MIPPLLFPSITWIFASFETLACVAYVSCCTKGTVQKYDCTLFQISREMTSEDATLHEMLSMETGSGPYFFSSTCISLEERAFQSSQYQAFKMLRDGWRKVKMFSLHELSNTLWMWGDPTQLLWTTKRNKNAFAVVQPLTCRWSCHPFTPRCFCLPTWSCRWGRNALRSSDLGWLERDCLLPG